MPPRAWVIALTRSTLRSFQESKEYLLALTGTRHLVSDLSLFETVRVLHATGLLGAFHSLSGGGWCPTRTGRFRGRATDPTFIPNLARSAGILRNARCVYIDSEPGAIVAAKLQGWEGCLVAAQGLLRVSQPSSSSRHGSSRASGEDARVGRGAWYDARFPSLRRALKFYIFGKKRRQK